MGDSKYGRLFTEEDVRSLMDLAVQAALEAERPLDEDELEGTLEGFAGHFLDGEPLFVLRGRDRLAPDAVQAYATAVHQDGETTRAMERSVELSLSNMLDWQSRNGDLVRTPTVSSAT